MQLHKVSVSKAFVKSWLSDPGAYGVMCVLGIGIVFPLSFGLYKVLTDPDARVSKNKRKAALRGELFEESKHFHSVQHSVPLQLQLSVPLQHSVEHHEPKSKDKYPVCNPNWW